MRVDTTKLGEWYKQRHNSRLNMKSWEQQAEAEGILKKQRSRMSLNGPGDLHFNGSGTRNCYLLQLPELAVNPLKVHTDKAIPDHSCDDMDESSSTS